MTNSKRKPLATNHPWRGPVFINGRRSEAARLKAIRAAAKRFSPPVTTNRKDQPNQPQQ